jgi:hypothetical protein
MSLPFVSFFLYLTFCSLLSKCKGINEQEIPKLLSCKIAAAEGRGLLFAVTSSSGTGQLSIVLNRE